VKVQEKDRFHGIALTQVVEHPSFKALNKASPHYGHYRINTDRQLFVKYRTHKGSSWQFVFSSAELGTIRTAIRSKDSLFVCLVCGASTVCALTSDEVQQLINVDLTIGTQWLTVEVPKGGSCRVRGSKGKLGRTVPHNSFPNKVFG
jgi:hypothetical protein